MAVIREARELDWGDSGVGTPKIKERRKTVRAKRPVQQRKGKICPKCGGEGVYVLDSDHTEELCSKCGGSGRLSPVA